MASGLLVTRITITVDAQTPLSINLNLGEDVLIRIPLGQLSSGSHTLTATHDGDPEYILLFRFP